MFSVYVLHWDVLAGRHNVPTEAFRGFLLAFQKNAGQCITTDYTFFISY
jgi:hypothetical protein